MGLGLGYSVRLGEVEVGEKVEEEVEGKLEEGLEGKVGQQVGVGAVLAGWVQIGGLGWQRLALAGSVRLQARRARQVSACSPLHQ